MEHKRPVLFFYLLLAGFLQPVFSQLSYQKDSTHVFSLVDRAEFFFTAGNYDSALYYCTTAEAYSRQKKFKKGIAYSFIERTDILIDKDELDKAAPVPAKTIALGQELNDSLVVAIATMQQAQIKMYSKKQDEAISLFEKCINNYFSHHPSKYAALAYNDFGYVLGDKGETEKKAGNLLKALKIYETTEPGNYSELAVTLSNLSSVYYEMNNREKAIEYAKRSLVFKEKTGDIAKLSLGCCNLSQMLLGINNEEAVKYQALCVKYAEQSGDELRILHSYITSSLIASNQKEIKKSAAYELKAIALLEKSGKYPDMLARRYISLAMSSASLKEDSVTTVTYFTKAEEQSKVIGSKANLRDVYCQLAAFYKNHQDFTKAYDYYSRHILYRDSIVNSSTASNIAELEKKYQAEKKDNEISQLSTDKRIKELQIEKQNALLAGNILEAKKKENEIELLSKQKELQDFKISQQEQELEKQQLYASNKEQQLQLTEKERQLQERKLAASKAEQNFLWIGLGMLLITGYVLFNRYQLTRKLKEKEALLTVRNNIAKDLHDDIGATLSNINILNELAKRNVNDAAKVNEYLEKSGEDIQQVSESISDIVWNINPKFDSPENLLVRMKRYAADMLEGKNILYEMRFPGELSTVSINMEQRRDLYMIFKEAVNNLVKYSAATKATINVEVSSQLIRMKIADNGKGFEMIAGNTGNGLFNMKQRTEKWKGIFLLNSTVGNGTAVVIEMPVLR